MIDLEKELISVEIEKYGDKYHDHVLDIYKKYLDMADRISDRRMISNNYFLALNTGIIGLNGLSKIITGGNFEIFKNQNWLINLLGIFLCYIWYRIIRSYKDLNAGKFKIVHQIEKLLPIRPFDAEWTAVGRGKDYKLYLPFTHLETKVPLGFLFLHALLIILSLIKL